MDSSRFNSCFKREDGETVEEEPQHLSLVSTDTHAHRVHRANAPVHKGRGGDGEKNNEETGRGERESGRGGRRRREGREEREWKERWRERGENGGLVFVSGRSNYTHVSELLDNGTKMCRAN